MLGATNIIIEIKNGGKTFIRVTDNGSGMELSDMQACIERHATSKIKKVEDLERSYTMGFRGEALASIASISHFTIISKTPEGIANKICVKAGNITEIEERAAQNGTTMIVEDLFFNTPVRYKFLKQDLAEFRYIKEWVQKAALANTNISFKLINEGKNIFSSSGNGKISDIIYLLYGKDIRENIIDVDYEENNIKVKGVIGNTMIARESRKDQIVFLNKRNIRNAVLTSSADQAFKGATGIGKYGFFILNLEMPANYYDVNVHPTKMEVRFKEEDLIYKIFYHAIKESMLNNKFLGNNEQTNKEEYVENELEFLTNKLEKSEEKTELRIRKEKRKIDYKYIGILLRTYIIIEIDNELYFIDQHAAHERVLYEKIKENYKNNMSNNTQMMIIPEVVNLSYKEMEFVCNNLEIIKNTGFDIEIFGENLVKLNGVPDIEYRGKTSNVFLDTLDEMISKERTAIKDVEERFIATVACKAAVKANMDLTCVEVDNLIQELLNLNNPYTCPHGRPTTIKYSKEELEKILEGK